MARNTDLYFVIFVTEFFYSCGNTYRHLTTKKNESYRNRDGNIRYRTVDAPLHVYGGHFTHHPSWEDSALKFKTAEEALAKAKELQEQGILPKGIEIKTSEPEYGQSRKMISVLQRPLADVIGKYRAFAVTFAKEHPDFVYDNEHRYQVARSNNFRWQYLIYDRETKAMEWTEDCTKATLFTKKEQGEVCEYANSRKDLPFKGHIQARNLPAKHDNAPKFKRGDTVRYMENGEEKEYEVYDIISFGDGWCYEVGCDHRWCYTSNADERFFQTTPFSDVFKEERLTLVKSA